MYATPAPGKTLSFNHVGPQEIKNKKRTLGCGSLAPAETGSVQALICPTGKSAQTPSIPLV
jgi:hypothetical protein